MLDLKMIVLIIKIQVNIYHYVVKKVHITVFFVEFNSMPAWGFVNSKLFSSFLCNTNINP